MALPLYLHHDEDRSVLVLHDSENDDLLPPTRHTPVAEPKRSSEAMRQKTKEATANVPVHPIPAMQPAFEESLLEATNNTGETKPKLKFGDAKQRRTQLLDSAKGSRLHGDLWRYRPGQKHHELWKLLAQVSFGVYLLLNGIANSNEQVVDILQHHIDEVDEFLETTLEDLNTAIEDVKERIDFLKLPMENMKKFETMLEDRDFRLQIVTGNEKIEHIIERTTLAMDATFKDVEEGIKGVKEFAVYLVSQRDETWRHERPELIEIYEAMKGNAQGWYQALNDLQDSASSLDNILVDLAQIVADMNQKVGEVSRRTRYTLAPFSGPAQPSHMNGRSEKLSSSSSSSRRPSVSPSPKAASESPKAASVSRAAVRPDSPAEKEVVFFEEKEVVFVHPTSSMAEDLRPEPQRPDGDEGVYLLQPRTYTPQPPAPLPSPMIKSPPDSQVSMFQGSASPDLRMSHRASLRQRISLKGGNLPEVIHVPPQHTTLEMESPGFLSSQQQLAPLTYRGRDEYVSSLEVQPSYPTIVEPARSMTIPRFPIPHAIPSPRSDQQQYFYPVRASPHSPLQQRPHTSATTRPHTSHAGHGRDQRSAMGMSMLSNVTNADAQNGKKLKKKRSAFGWLKKAFTLDEEEKEEFKARKQQQLANPYYEAHTPKFLDGKRLPDPRRMDGNSARSVSRYGG